MKRQIIENSLSIPIDAVPAMMTGSVMQRRFTTTKDNKIKSVCSGFPSKLEMTSLRHNKKEIIVSLNRAGFETGGDFLALMNKQCNLN